MSSRRPRLALLAALTVLVASACSGAEDRNHNTTSSPPASASRSPSPSSTPGAEAPADASRGGRVSPAFFGMHDGRITQGLTPEGAGALRLWDSGTSWRDLETSPGQFTWDSLDTAVEAAEAAGARPLLVLGQTPAFHATRPKQEAAYGPGAASMPRMAAWKGYVRAVAERYGDRVDYQMWNETNVIGYWTGTPRQMAELTMAASRVIRDVARRATVVAPPFALRLPGQQQYFADFWSWQSRGIDIASAVDAVAVHLYPLAEDPPEAQVKLFEFAREVLAEHEVELPVWNTEINFGLQGGPEPPPIPAERQRAFLMRAYLLNAGLGIKRVYWYRWDLAPIANTLLTTSDYSAPTLAGRAFPTIRDWLEGTVVRGCELSEGLWECTARAGGETRTFWWKPRGAVTPVPAGERAESWTDADGDVTRCRDGCEVPVGQTPVMVTSR